MKLTLVFVMMIVFGVMISACVSQAPQTPALTTVKVAYQPTTANGPLYIAKEEGYFAQQGINVEFEKTQSATASLPLLISGDVAVTGGPLKIGLINSVIKGGHVRIVADKGRLAPGFCDVTSLMVRRDLFDKGIVRHVSDLKGRKIAVRDQDYDIFRALAVGNLTFDDVDTVIMEFATVVISFENGAIDAGILSEPYVTQALNSGSAVVLVPGQDFIPNWTSPLYYGPAILDKNPELGKRFMVAYLQGVKQYNEGKTERNLEIIQNYTGLDRDLLKQSCWPQIAEDGVVPKQFNRDYMDWMYVNKKITQKLNDDQLYDMSYITYANGVLRNTTNNG